MVSNPFFYFKGKRDYIQSGNILDYIIAETNQKAPKNVDFKLSRMTGKTWYLAAEPPHSPEQLIGTYKDDTCEYFIIESEINISDRRPYDEEFLIRQFTIDENSIVIPDGIDNYSFLEKANAAFKALLSQSVVSNAPVSYIFVRLILDYVPHDGFTIRYSRIFANKFCEGEILDNTLKVGAIYFSKEVNT